MPNPSVRPAVRLAVLLGVGAFGLLSILALPARAQSATSWVQDFSTANLKGILAPESSAGIVPFSAATIDTAQGVLPLTLEAQPSSWKPLIQKGWGMELNPALDYLVEIRLAITSSDPAGAPVAVRFTWNDGPTDGLPVWEQTNEVIDFAVVPNAPLQTFTFNTADTVTWPNFAGFGTGPDVEIGGFRLEFGTEGLVDPATLHGQTVTLDRIAFRPYTGAVERRVYASYFSGAATRGVSGHADNWRLYGDTNADTIDDVAWSGDVYTTTERKDVSNTFAPLIGQYDVIDPDVSEYDVLLARLAGIDGFLVEVTIPGSHSDDAMESLADLVSERGWDFQVGLHWSTAPYFDWHPLKDEWMGDRALAMEQASLELVDWLEEHYDPATRRGAWVGGHPLVLFFAPTATNPPGMQGGFGPDDFEALKDAADLADWTGVLEPWFVGRNTGWMDLLHPYLEGTFGWVGGDGVEPAPGEPWTDAQTIDQLMAPGGHVDDFYDVAQAVGADFELIMGPVTRGFDDHKGKAWMSGSKRWLEHDGTRCVEETWDEFELREPLDERQVVLINNWSDWEEGTVFLPTREFAYRQLEALGERVWSWRGTPALYDAALLRLPKRLLEVRRSLRFLEQAGYVASELTAPLAAANAAGDAIHDFDSATAEDALEDAEGELVPLLQGLERRWVHAEWEHGVAATALDVEPTQDLVPVTVDGKSGLELIPGSFDFRLFYKVVDAGLLADMQAGHFVGKIAFEVLDRGRDYVELRTDAPSLHPYDNTDMAVVVSLRGRDTGTWRRMEVDLVNTDWSGAFDGGSHLAFLQYSPPTAPDPDAIRWVRIEGTIYRKP
jgi:hypothetical protein